MNNLTKREQEILMHFQNGMSPKRNFCKTKHWIFNRKRTPLQYKKKIRYNRKMYAIKAYRNRY